MGTNKKKYTQPEQEDLQSFISEQRKTPPSKQQKMLPPQVYQALGRVGELLSFWTFNIAVILTCFFLMGHTTNGELLEEDGSAVSNQTDIRYVIKGTLIYCLGWVVIMTIHQGYSNDYMKILKADTRDGFKRITLLSLKVGLFYWVALQMPANHIANRLLAILTLYIWLSQKYVRKAMVFNYHAMTIKRMQFVCNLSMNQGTSLVFIMSPLMKVLLPELPWLPGFITLFPIFCRFTQCYIVGTHEQFLNSIKFTLNLIAFGFSVVQMPVHSHYWRIAAAAYSFYWDICRDWKWKIRFYEQRNWRIDLPMRFFWFGFFYDLFGRVIWIIFPMQVKARGLVEMTRRLAWIVLRIERQQVFYFDKPEKNNVKDLDWWFTK